jgi:protein FAM32A
MPSDDYAPLGGGGALKLKGAKVDKKKKKKKAKTDLVKNISGPDESSKPKTPDAATEDREQDDAFVPQKTEAEQRHEEIRRKRVCCVGKIFVACG